MIFDIVNGTNSGRSKEISCTDLVNFYPEIEDPSKSKHPKALINCPGYRLAVTAYTKGYCRALYVTGTERMFAVIFDKLIEISVTETATVRGTLNTTTDMCAMADNGSQLLIIDGKYGYIFTLSTNALVTITDAQFPASPTHCIFTDGYFLVNSAGTGVFNFSASYDGTSWDALDFATAEYTADSLQGIAKTSNGTIWMIGKQSLELWNNVGVADLPWRRIQGAVHEVGGIAPHSIASDGSRVFFLGNGQNGYASVFMGAGYEVTKISTHAIENQIKQLSGIQNATAFTYSDEGHSFYVLNFTSQKTLVYDLNTGEWHRRGTLNASLGENIRQFAQGCAFLNGKLYVGSYLNGGIYEMSLDLYTEAGNEIRREIVTNHLSNENRLVRHNYLELDFERGTGLEGGTELYAAMRLSDNGGRTWSEETAISMGKMGEYDKECRFSRLGKSCDRVYELIVCGSEKCIITNAFVGVEA